MKKTIAAIAAVLLLAGCSSGKSTPKTSAQSSSSFVPYAVSAVPGTSAAVTDTPVPTPTLATATAHRTDDDFIAALYGSKYKAEFYPLGDSASVIDLAKTICDQLRATGDVQGTRAVLEQSLTTGASLLFLADTESTYCPDQLPS